MNGNDESRRELAIRRLKEKHDFRLHLFVYVAVNALLVAIWAFTQGFFWPIFSILGWGIGVAGHWYAVYHGSVYSEGEIQREMKKLP